MHKSKAYWMDYDANLKSICFGCISCRALTIYIYTYMMLFVIFIECISYYKRTRLMIWILKFLIFESITYYLLMLITFCVLDIFLDSLVNYWHSLFLGSWHSNSNNLDIFPICIPLFYRSLYVEYHLEFTSVCTLNLGSVKIIFILF